MFESLVDLLFDVSFLLGNVLLLVLGTGLTLGGLGVSLICLLGFFSIVGYVLRIPRLIFDKSQSIEETFGIFIISFIIGAILLFLGTFVLGAFLTLN